MNKIWLVTYEGPYLGGKAIVIAPDLDTAIMKVQHDPRTVNFNDIEAFELKEEGRYGSVIYNDIGDY